MRIHRTFDLRDPNAFGVGVSGDNITLPYEQDDIVICSPQKQCKKSGGYCVVVTTENEALVKKVKDEGDRFILSSIAPSYEPFTLPKQSVRAVHKIVWK